MIRHSISLPQRPQSHALQQCLHNPAFVCEHAIRVSAHQCWVYSLKEN